MVCASSCNKIWDMVVDRVDHTVVQTLHKLLAGYNEQAAMSGSFLWVGLLISRRLTGHVRGECSCRVCEAEEKRILRPILYSCGSLGHRVWETNEAVKILSHC